MSVTQPLARPRIVRVDAARLHRAGLAVAVALLFALFALSAPGFLTVGNLRSLLVDHVVVLGCVAGAMTLVVIAGGIDLSLGTSADMASLAFAQALLAGFGFAGSLGCALAASLAVGLFNAVLIGGLGIAPFLATLGTLFIGQSVQQLASDGGQTIYLMNVHLPAAIGFVSLGRILGVPVPVWLSSLCLAALWFATDRTAFGQRLMAAGLQPAVARLSGLPVRRDTAFAYMLAAACCAITGVILTATVKSYSPGAGSAFTLDAIGAVFIGTTMHRGGRANILGTTLGVVMLSITADGLVLVGWPFEWQRVANGLLVLAVLGISFGARARRA